MCWIGHDERHQATANVQLRTSVTYRDIQQLVRTKKIFTYFAVTVVPHKCQGTSSLHEGRNKDLGQVLGSAFIFSGCGSYDDYAMQLSLFIENFHASSRSIGQTATLAV